MKEKFVIQFILLSGVMLPYYYFSLISFLGFQWRGYTWTSNLMSELGAVGSPFKDITNVAGFMVVGLVMMVLGRLLLTRIWLEESLQYAAFFIMIAGLFIVGVGLFPCDYGCNNSSLIGHLHTVMTIPPAFLITVAAVVVGIASFKLPDWGRGWSVLSLAMGVVSAAAGPAVFYFEGSDWVGVIQRVGFGLSLVWISLISGKALRDYL